MNDIDQYWDLETENVCSLIDRELVLRLMKVTEVWNWCHYQLIRMLKLEEGEFDYMGIMGSYVHAVFESLEHREEEVRV